MKYELQLIKHLEVNFKIAVLKYENNNDADHHN